MGNCHARPKIKEGLLLLAFVVTTACLGQSAHHTRLMIQLGNETTITAVAISSDGAYATTGDESGAVILWECRSGRMLWQNKKLGGVARAIRAMKFLPDRKKLFVANVGGSAHLLDLTTGMELAHFDLKSYLLGVDLSSDGNHILSVDGDHTELETLDGKEKPLSLAGGTCVAFSPDGKQFLVAERSQISIWDVASMRQVRRLDSGRLNITTAAFSTDGNTILVGGGDRYTRLLDIRTGEEVKRFGGLSYTVTSVAFSPDALGVYAQDEFGNVILWDKASALVARSFTPGEGPLGMATEGNPQSFALSDDGSLLITANHDRKALLWKTKSGLLLRPLRGITSVANGVVFSPTGDKVASTGSGDIGAIWSLRVAGAPTLLIGHKGEIQSIAFSPDGRSVLTGSVDNTARLWDAMSGREIQRFTGHSAAVFAVAYSPDGKTVLTGSSDMTARLWSATSGIEVRQFKGHLGGIWGVSFSSDGHSILTASADGTARKWDVATGLERQRYSGHTGMVRSAVFSHDDSKVLTAGADDSARLWNAGTGVELRRFGNLYKGEATSAAFSPDDRSIIVGHKRDATSLWQISGDSGVHLDGEPGDINSVSFSRDGQVILTSGLDGQLRLWESRTGRELVSFCTFGDRNWLASDALGRYDTADSDDQAAIHWVTDNLRTISVAQLKQEYYTPGLLSRVASGKRLPDVSGLGTVSLPPLLEISKPFDPTARSLAIRETNEGGGFDTLIVKVNRRQINQAESLYLSSGNAIREFRVDLSNAPLVPGENTVRLTTFDSTNHIESDDLTVTVSMSPEPDTVIHEQEALAKKGETSRLFAIVIGTSSYADSRINLSYPAKDAQNFSTGLRIGAERMLGKNNVWIRTLVSDAGSADDLPTKKNIRDAFNHVRSLALPNDTFVVYFSGHGIMSNKDSNLYYYLTIDARPFDSDPSPELRDLSTVSSKELFEWLREPVKTMPLKEVVILDTCAAGSASETLARLAMPRDLLPDQQRAIELLKDATGTFILMGSAADSVSFESSKYGQGLLTYALLQGMRGEALVDGSRLEVSRWFEKASEDVPYLAKSIGGVQVPIIAAPHGKGFPVALLTAEDRARIPFASHGRQLLRLVCEDENQADPLRLRPLVREQLRTLDVNQRIHGTDSMLIYLDATEEDLPGAMTPKVQYKMIAGKLRVRIRLTADGNIIADRRLLLSAQDPRKQARLIYEEIVTLAQRTGSPRPRPNSGQ